MQTIKMKKAIQSKYIEKKHIKQEEKQELESDLFFAINNSYISGEIINDAGETDLGIFGKIISIELDDYKTGSLASSLSYNFNDKNQKIGINFNFDFILEGGMTHNDLLKGIYYYYHNSVDFWGKKYVCFHIGIENLVSCDKIFFEMAGIHSRSSDTGKINPFFLLENKNSIIYHNNQLEIASMRFEGTSTITPVIESKNGDKKKLNSFTINYTTTTN